MKTVFSNKRSILLIEAAISLLILSTMVAEFISTPQVAQARTTISHSCTNASQNYPYSHIWPSVGQEFLKETSQELMAKTSNTIGTQQIYFQLISNGNCSLATLVQKKYKVINPGQAYQFEKHILTTVQSQLTRSTIPDVRQGLTWVMSQKDQTLVDKWISLAILSHSNKIPLNNHPSSILTPSFSNTDYQDALNVFCNVFQHDITNYLYSTVTPVHLQTMVSNLRNSAGNSV